MFCPYCGSTLQEGDISCPKCGRSVEKFTFHPMKLPDAIAAALDDAGLEVLRAPSRLTGYVMDYVPEEDRVGTTFVNNCDEEFLWPFVQAVSQISPASRISPDALEGAANRAGQLLTVERSIVDYMATAVTQGVAQGVGKYFGVEVQFSATAKEGESKSDDDNGREKPGGSKGAGDSQGSQGHVDMDGSRGSWDYMGPGDSQVPGRSQVSRGYQGQGGSQVQIGYQGQGGFQGTGGSQGAGGTQGPGGAQGSGGSQGWGGSQGTGGSQTTRIIQCAFCGTNNTTSDSYCTGCGRPLNAVKLGPTDPSPSRSKAPMVIAAVAGVAVIIVALFLLLDPASLFVDSSSHGSTTDSSTSEASDPIPEDYPDPVFQKATASSTLPPEDDGHGYGPEQVLDDDQQTCWAEGSNGDDVDKRWPNAKGSEYDELVGKGEWIKLSAKETQYVSGIRIQNGYPKVKDLSKGLDSETYYYYNTRPHDITIELSDGWSLSVELQDAGPGAWQEIDFGATLPTKEIKITIDSVYDTKEDGSRTDWPDTSIDEIKVY
ncbi:MAG: zinc ribbon domain-containing protein [Atopobiaceae bacterium]|nr:zinc ribbon domain-containing protein [Atopobiaceae bacterium]